MRQFEKLGTKERRKFRNFILNDSEIINDELFAYEYTAAKCTRKMMQLQHSSLRELHFLCRQKCCIYEYEKLREEPCFLIPAFSDFNCRTNVSW